MDFVYIKKNSLDKVICDKIIEKFTFEEQNNKTYEGQTSKGVDKRVKYTTDFNIGIHNSDTEWLRIRKTLETELLHSLKRFTEKENMIYKEFGYKAIPHEMYFETLQIQRYVKNQGVFTYHHDEVIRQNDRRVLTYIWYLNDVTEGGETEICVKHKVKPETGKLMIFPASWMFPHRGIMPVSNDKYIITGWIFTSNQNV